MTKRDAIKHALDEFAAIDSEALEPQCQRCGCCDSDCSQCIERTGLPCAWVAPHVCSGCATPAELAAAGLESYYHA